MTRRRVLDITGQVALTLAAVIGLACIVITVLAIAFGVKPFIDITGSMVPVIPVKSLLLTTVQPATTARKGDIVGVNSNGVVIVHRVVSTSPAQDGQVSLVLKGDANSAADPEPYVVKVIYHPFAIMPVLGRIVSALMSWAGAFGLGVAGGAMVTVGLARWSRSRPAGDPGPAPASAPAG